MNVSYDFMHTKHLGVDQVQFGAILHLLCFAILPKQPLQNLEICWKHIAQSYKDNGIVERYRGMRKLTLFSRKNKSPKLKGRAAQIAALGVPLLSLWEKYMNGELEVHKKIKTLLKANVALEKIMQENRHEIAFNASSAKKFKQLAFALTQLHMDLSLHFENELFPDIPKIHHFLHSCMQSGVLNPRLTWCYKGEDYQRITRTLASSSAKGLQGPQVANKMLAKLRAGWHLKFSHYGN